MMLVQHQLTCRDRLTGRSGDGLGLGEEDGG